jgi:DNA-binding CsgD family transcriptional regulator
MLADWPFAASAEDGGHRGAAASPGCLELLCLLRLSEIALADPPPEAGVRAMVDEIARLSWIERGAIALLQPEGTAMRHVAHRGLPGRAAHRDFTDETSAVAARAMAERRIIELPTADGGRGSGCVTVPILAGEQALGILGLSLSGAVPLGPWLQEWLWASADLVALVLLGRQPLPAPLAPDQAPGELRLTRRQRDVLFALVERGGSNEVLAASLGLSARTVKIHLQAAYRQLGVRSRGEAIRLLLTRHADWLAGERQRRHR